jgi:hypothetical protein
MGFVGWCAGRNIFEIKKMMKRIVLLLFVLVSVCALQAQQIIVKDSTAGIHKKEKTKNNFNIIQHNSIYYEIIGNSPLLSLNYERIIFWKKKFCLSARTGISFVWSSSSKTSGFREFTTQVPLLINELYRCSNRLFIETGSGLVFVYEHDYQSNLQEQKVSSKYYRYYPTAIIGIRYQSIKGFLFRADFTPVFIPIKYETGISVRYEPLIGISLGYSFGK